MIDINTLKDEIVKQLEPLGVEKIILFGSYAYGKPHAESDIDLFVVKEMPKEDVRGFDLQMMRLLRRLVFKYRVSFDVFSDAPSRIEKRINGLQDYFYKDIMEKGRVLWEIKH